MPLLVHGQQVVTVHNLSAAAGAEGDALAGQTGERLRVRAEQLHTDHPHLDTHTHKHTTPATRARLYVCVRVCVCVSNFKQFLLSANELHTRTLIATFIPGTFGNVSLISRGV